jgi:lysophospholipase L1-like esterase
MSKKYLALGDSYTIGEQVPLFDSFPYQLIQLLRKKSPEQQWHAPEIIAKTGWTTDELLLHINQTIFLPTYDLVTLLIGVNNQYRGRATDNYREEYEILLQKAIAFAGGDLKKVLVLSIPDWGTMPFAEGRDVDQIAKEIDRYNAACKEITENIGVRFIDITFSQRADAKDRSYIASDGLHPSGKEYKKWSEKIMSNL